MNYQNYRVGQSRAKTEPALGRLVPAFASCHLLSLVDTEQRSHTDNWAHKPRPQRAGIWEWVCFLEPLC